MRGFSGPGAAARTSNTSSSIRGQKRTRLEEDSTPCKRGRAEQTTLASEAGDSPRLEDNGLSGSNDTCSNNDAQASNKDKKWLFEAVQRPYGDQGSAGLLPRHTVAENASTANQGRQTWHKVKALSSGAPAAAAAAAGDAGGASQGGAVGKSVVYTGPTDVPGGVGRDGDRAGAGVRKKGKYRASRGLSTQTARAADGGMTAAGGGSADAVEGGHVSGSASGSQQPGTLQECTPSAPHLVGSASGVAAIPANVAGRSELAAQDKAATDAAASERPVTAASTSSPDVQAGYFAPLRDLMHQRSAASKQMDSSNNASAVAAAAGGGPSNPARDRFPLLKALERRGPPAGQSAKPLQPVGKPAQPFSGQSGPIGVHEGFGRDGDRAGADIGDDRASSSMRGTLQECAPSAPHPVGAAGDAAAIPANIAGRSELAAQDKATTDAAASERPVTAASTSSPEVEADYFAPLRHLMHQRSAASKQRGSNTNASATTAGGDGGLSNPAQVPAALLDAVERMGPQAGQLLNSLQLNESLAQQYLSSSILPVIFFPRHHQEPMYPHSAPHTSEVAATSAGAAAAAAGGQLSRCSQHHTQEGQNTQQHPDRMELQQAQQLLAIKDMELQRKDQQLLRVAAEFDKVVIFLQKTLADREREKIEKQRMHDSLRLMGSVMVAQEQQNSVIIGELQSIRQLTAATAASNAATAASNAATAASVEVIKSKLDTVQHGLEGMESTVAAAVEKSNIAIAGSTAATNSSAAALRSSTAVVQKAVTAIGIAVPISVAAAVGVNTLVVEGASFLEEGRKVLAGAALKTEQRSESDDIVPSAPGSPVAPAAPSAQAAAKAPAVLSASAPSAAVTAPAAAAAAPAAATAAPSAPAPTGGLLSTSAAHLPSITADAAVPKVSATAVGVAKSLPIGPYCMATSYCATAAAVGVDLQPSAPVGAALREHDTAVVRPPFATIVDEHRLLPCLPGVVASASVETEDVSDDDDDAQSNLASVEEVATLITQLVCLRISASNEDTQPSVPTSIEGESEAASCSTVRLKAVEAPTQPAAAPATGDIQVKEAGVPTCFPPPPPIATAPATGNIKAKAAAVPSPLPPPPTAAAPNNDDIKVKEAGVPSPLPPSPTAAPPSTGDILVKQAGVSSFWPPPPTSAPPSSGDIHVKKAGVSSPWPPPPTATAPSNGDMKAKDAGVPSPLPPPVLAVKDGSATTVVAGTVVDDGLEAAVAAQSAKPATAQHDGSDASAAATVVDGVDGSVVATVDDGLVAAFGGSAAAATSVDNGPDALAAADVGNDSSDASAAAAAVGVNGSVAGVANDGGLAASATTAIAVLDISGQQAELHSASALRVPVALVPEAATPTPALPVPVGLVPSVVATSSQCASTLRQKSPLQMGFVRERVEAINSMVVISSTKVSKM